MLTQTEPQRPAKGNKKKSWFFMLFLVIIFTTIFARNLNPLSPTMFTFHDETQPSRISEFTLNIKNGIFPPRLAPRYSYNLGYPTFQFYAPFPYLISSIINITGFDTAATLQIAFALALIIGFISMYWYLRHFFSLLSAVLGSVLYATAPYIAVEIFVRGNLGEMWFFALFPLALGLLHENIKHHKNAIVFIATTLTLSAVLTSHNIFALIFLPIAFVYTLLLSHRLRNMLALLVALLLSSYFLIPAITENGLTYAQEVATLTNYGDHFLCPFQLWASPWGYGGSAEGCVFDGMSFKLGRLAILIALIGATALIKCIIKKEKSYVIFSFIALMTAGSIFLTLQASAPLWSALSPIFALFQFPWRFLLLAVFGIGFTGAFAFENNNIFIKLLALVAIALLIVSNAKYFVGQTVAKNEFLTRYDSAEYIQKTVAYKVAEYLPKTARLKKWRSLAGAPERVLQKNLLPADMPASALDGERISINTNKAFYKQFSTSSRRFILQLHYFPLWEIMINGTTFTPTKFDKLGRPIIINDEGKLLNVTVVYRQTPIGKNSTVISFITLIALLALLYKPLWIKLQKTHLI